MVISSYILITFQDATEQYLYQSAPNNIPSAGFMSLSGEIKFFPGSSIPLPGRFFVIPGDLIPLPGRFFVIPGDLIPLPGSFFVIPGRFITLPRRLFVIPCGVLKKVCGVLKNILILKGKLEQIIFH